MVLHFPDSDSLRLALTSGVVPSMVSLARVRAGFDPQGPLWVEPSVNLSRAAQKELTRLGVSVVKGQEKRLTETFTCWPQLLPLQRRTAAPETGSQTPVLFELPSAAMLPTIVGEVLRLGNDRQSFRALAGDADQCTLLRIVGPPYYTLLRALDREGNTDAPLAYLEGAPRVWVQVGYSHPLLNLLQPPPGKFVLLKPPRSWLFVEEAPFRDVYEILEFSLPQPAVNLHELSLEQRLRVPLHLVPGGAHDVAELWVLRERGLEQIDELVRNAGDLLLPRLAFAVGEHNGKQTYVLRVRPSKLPTPVLVLQDALGFRPYLHLPNLFLPCGTRLQPLRRDAVRKLLAEQTGLITWLYPDADGRGFTPESLPDHTFRPLVDWIDYVLEHDHVALQTWVESTRFEFDSFICRDDQEPTTPDKPKKPQRDRRGDRSDTDKSTPATAPAQFQAPPKQTSSELDKPLERKHVEPSQLEKELKELEQQFLACTGPVDAEERLHLWPRLAELNSDLRRWEDAMICWANALWNGGADTPALARRWAAEENQAFGGFLTQQHLERLLSQKESISQDIRRLAACAIAAPEHPQAEPLRQRLADVQMFLQRHETQLPVRVVWLAALALDRLSGGDVLALTRCRDRLLERLYRNGLATDLDLPSFLRFSAVRGDRLRVFRDWLFKLPERVEHWLTHVDRGEADPRHSNAYAQLIQAFALARLGDDQECRRLQTLAHVYLTNKSLPEPEIHALALAAFEERVRQALANEPTVGPLSAEWLTRVEQMEHTPRYKLDKLRQYSRILEPHVKVEPHFRFIVRYIGDADKALNRLQDVSDRQQLQDELRLLLAQVGRSSAEEKEGWARLLTGSLALAPRVGEAFAEELLEDVFPCCDVLEELARSKKKSNVGAEVLAFEKQTELLERALFVAAHFNQTQRVQQLVGRFRKLLQAQQGPGMLKALNAVAAQSFRGLRKLGLRDQTDQLLRQMAEVLLQGREMSALRDEKLWPETLTILLRIADGWYYFSKDAEANAVVEEARRLLYTGDLHPSLQYPLALAYLSTLTQAPVDKVLHGIEELFAKLKRVHDGFQSNSHFAVRQLHLIESVVLAVVSDDFALGAQARRWLDDEEYLIRKRIHHDVSEANKPERG